MDILAMTPPEFDTKDDQEEILMLVLDQELQKYNK